MSAMKRCTIRRLWVGFLREIKYFWKPSGRVDVVSAFPNALG